MTPQALKDFRTKQGWSQKQLAEHLNALLDRKYTSSTISAWEREREPLPQTVATLLGELELEQAAETMFPSEPVEGVYETDDPLGPDSAGGKGEEDSAPPPPPGAGSGGTAAQLPLPGSSMYAKVCEELWEMVATGVGLVGAATGSEQLKRDGQIILEDKRALGRAYGKLAETNDTFRRMIVGATSGGAWLEVALVTGLTAGKIARNHQVVTPRLSVVEPGPEPETGVSFNGDSGVVNFPQQG